MEYCSVRLELKAPENLDPAESFNGKVTFTPDIARGDVWNGGGSLTPSVRVDAYIVDNNLQGSDGKKLVTLFAGGPGVNPEQVYWRIAFDDLYVGDQRVHIDPFVFEAIPGAVLDLAEVTPVAGYTPPGIIRGEKGDPGFSFKGVFNKESELPLDNKKGDAWANLSSKDLYVWNGSKWEVVTDFGKVDVGLENINEYVKQAEQYSLSSKATEDRVKAAEGRVKDSEDRARADADRAEFAAEETVQQVEGDFATRNYVENAVWSKKPLSSGDNINVLSSGAYPVPSGTIATDLGLPEANAGTLHHYDLDPSRLYRRQYFRADPTTGVANEYRRTYYNGNWREWAVNGVVPYRRGKVEASQNPDTMTGSEFEGLWNYDSSQAIAWGLPSRSAGFIDISVSGPSTLQTITTLTTPIQSYRRRWYLSSWSGGWESTGSTSESPVSPEAPEGASSDEYAISTSKSAVNLLMPSVVDPTLSYADDHAALMDDLKSRLGTVVPEGKAAVALVADHGTTVFKEWMWAEAKARDIPFTMALAPESHLDGKGDSRHAASNEDIKQWIAEGLVIASHSGDHGGASGYFDVSRQIQTSKMKLEEKLETQVDCWVQPGYALALGSYDGFGTGQSTSRYTDYYAGRMLQQNYAVVTGYAGDDFVYPGDVDLPVGVRRSLTERKDNQASVLATIEQAIATGGKHINFCHPYALVESSNTYVTKSEYIEYLDWLAAKRDAGDLVLLTLPQLAVARNTPPVVFEYGTEWSITSEPVPDWTVWPAGRVYPPAGHYYIETEGGARAEVRPSGTGNSIVSGSVVFVEQGEHILGMYGKQGHKIMIYPL